MKAKSLPRSFPARFLGVGLSLTILVSQAHAQSSSNERVLYRFNGTSSAHPNGGLARDDAGNLYGTAGLFAFGIIYRFSPNDGVATTLYSFSGGTDGSAPFGTI